jgi:hypothetical protein
MGVRNWLMLSNPEAIEYRKNAEIRIEKPAKKLAEYQ